MFNKLIKYQTFSTKLILLLSIYCYSYTTTTVSAKENTQLKYHNLQVKIVLVPEIETFNTTHIHHLISDNLLLCKASQEKKLTKSRIDNLYAASPKELLEILQTIGYYHASILERNLIMNAPNSWVINYRIQLGQPTQINSAKLNFCTNIPIEIQTQLEQVFFGKFTAKTQLNHAQYESTKQWLISYLKGHGFLKAEIKDAKILINLSDYSAAIWIDIDPKARYRLGKVLFKSDQYDEVFLSKYIPFMENDWYSLDKLMQFRNNLLKSELFKKVRIDVADYKTIDNQTLPITARVYAKSANRSIASVGFASDTGFRGKVGFIHNFYNKPGDVLDTSTAITKHRKKAILDYQFLGSNVLTSKYNYGVIFKQDNIKNRFNKTIENYWKKTYSHYNKQNIFQISCLYERYRELPQTNIYTTWLLIPSIQINWLKHHQVHPNNYSVPNPCSEQQEQNIVTGSKISINLKTSLNRVLSSISMLQATLTTTHATQFLDNYRFIVRTKLGSTFIKSFQQLPLSLRFFAGGDYSIRGFGYNSLGPSARSPNGNYGIIGGKHILLASLQLERSIHKYPNLAVASFVDLGNATNNFSNFLQQQAAIGAGAGVVYHTLIGSINFYLAKPIKLPSSDYHYKKEFRIHLTFTADL